MAPRSICGVSGAVEDKGEKGMFAHFQHRDDRGQNQNIRGPRRGEKREAEMDLDILWEAGLQADADAVWESIAAEARRLREGVNFGRAVATRAYQYARTQATTPPLQMEIDSLESEQAHESQEYDNDANEVWQEIDDEGRLPSTWAPAPRIHVPDPDDAVGASALLSRFRPGRMGIDDLKKLLEARADPNISLHGDISPLMKVMTFAGADRVAAMRELLLEAGAFETDEDRERWLIRRRADECEGAWMRNFHRDPR